MNKNDKRKSKKNKLKKNKLEFLKYLRILKFNKKVYDSMKIGYGTLEV